MPHVGVACLENDKLQVLTLVCSTITIMPSALEIMLAHGDSSSIHDLGAKALPSAKRTNNSGKSLKI